MAASKIQRNSLLSQISKRVKNPELVKKFEEILADDTAAEELNSMFLSRSEATKLVQSIKEQEKEVEAQRQKLATDYSNLQAWEIRAKQEEITAKQQAIEVAKEANQVLKSLREKAQADTLTLADVEAAYSNPKIASFAALPAPTPTTPTKKEPAPTTTKETPMATSTTSVTPNQEEAGKAFIQGIGKLFKLQNDHRKLFGEDLDVDGLIATALQENRGVDEVYADAYDVQGKQKELEAAAFEAAVNERVEKLVSEKVASLVDPSGKSSHIADFAGMMKGTTSPVWSGLGMTAKELNPDFRQLTMTKEELDAAESQRQSAVLPIPNQRQEEMEIAKEFATNLANRG